MFCLLDLISQAPVKYTWNTLKAIHFYIILLRLYGRLQLIYMYQEVAFEVILNLHLGKFYSFGLLLGIVILMV